jgi:hypothetical protein
MGTTLNAAPIKAGDSIEIKIEGIGSLINPVIDEQRVNSRCSIPARANLSAAA